MILLVYVVCKHILGLSYKNFYVIGHGTNFGAFKTFETLILL